MRIRHAGRVCDGIWCLGRLESDVYLLEGRDSSLIISGGISAIIPDVLSQFNSFKIDESRITGLLILHAHFDHLGIIPFLKRRMPRLEVYASSRAWKVLTNPKAIETINTFSSFTNELLGAKQSLSSFDAEWRDDVKGTTIGEGEALDLGSMTVKIMETPGHSSCSISAYIPEIKALFASDGGGIPFRDEIIPSGNSNYTQFEQSLTRLNALDVEYLCADHYGYVTGDEARAFIGNAIEAAKLFRELMETVYRRTGSIDDAVNELVENTMATHSDYFLPKDILTTVYQQMMKHIASVSEGRHQVN
ncbi:MAG: MBL fold metallo-hydrolase [Deltaproteobacteria bacterium]|nr:MBL fold metallo-hydrolase [Deltaproteobacteria bacterium]